MLKLMYITNEPEVAQIAESAGVDRIFVDMEYIGKALRQGGMDTVQSHHTVEDVAKIREAVQKADLMVRINPIHEASKDYVSSKEEIDAVIQAGADIVMLPFFKTVEEVRRLIELVNGRAKVLPLLETPEKHPIWFWGDCFFGKGNAAIRACDQRALSSWIYLRDTFTELLFCG